MSAHIKTQEVVDAAVAKLNAAALSFSPKLIQDGDLSWYVENDALSTDLPAVFVTAGELELEVTGESDLTDVGGQALGVRHALRILVAFIWTDTEDLNRRRRLIAQEVAEVLVGTAGTAFDLGGVAGTEALQALPTGIEFEPAEHSIVSKDQTRQVAAVAVTASVRYRAMR